MILRGDSNAPLEGRLLSRSDLFAPASQQSLGGGGGGGGGALRQDMPAQGCEKAAVVKTKLSDIE